MLAFSVEARIGIRLSAGVSTGTTAPLDATRQAAFRRFPLRLGAYWPVPLGVGQLEPGLGLDLDLISVSIRERWRPSRRSPSLCSGRPVSQRRARTWRSDGPSASTHHVYLRALARAGPGGLLRLRA